MHFLDVICAWENFGMSFVWIGCVCGQLWGVGQSGAYAPLGFWCSIIFRNDLFGMKLGGFVLRVKRNTNRQKISGQDILGDIPGPEFFQHSGKFLFWLKMMCLDAGIVCLLSEIIFPGQDQDHGPRPVFGQKVQKIPKFIEIFFQCIERSNNIF